MRKGVEVKESAQILMTRIEKSLRASSIESVEIEDYPSTSDCQAISFLTIYDEEGMASYNYTLAQMNWQEYIIFYLEDDPAVSKDGYYRLCSRKVFLGDFLDNYEVDILSALPYPPNSSPGPANPMKSYITGSVVPLDYLSDPRYITRNVTGLKFEKEEELSQVEISVEIGKPLNPSDPNSEEDPDKMKLSATIILRNR